MNQVKEYARLREQLEWVKTRIRKVRLIMNLEIRDINPEVMQSFRKKLLTELENHEAQLEEELNDLVDDVSLDEEALSEALIGIPGG
jgi:hypothetical protein